MLLAFFVMLLVRIAVFGGPRLFFLDFPRIMEAVLIFLSLVDLVFLVPFPHRYLAFTPFMRPLLLLAKVEQSRGIFIFLGKALDRIAAVLTLLLCCVLIFGWVRAPSLPSL